jgi:hypothetical protein
MRIIKERELKLGMTPRIQLEKLGGREIGESIAF